MSKHLTTLSKFLSLVLRHQPEVIGIILDDHGWTDIDGLLSAATRAGKPLTRDLLFQIVHENDKQRFAIDETGTKIRANQGHSIEVDLALPPQQPPEILYHGTVERFLSAIRSEGLRPGERQHVHLSADEATAKLVGSRRGKPVVLTIAAGTMFQQGILFYKSANGVWLTLHVPAEFIQFPSS